MTNKTTLIKSLSFFIVHICAVNFGFGQMNDLIISEYGEGTNFNKYIEIFNGTGADIDLANYELWRIVNGNPTWPEFTTSLLGTLINGDTYVIANPSANAAILAAADFISGVITWNGNDAVGLAKDDGTGTFILIDAIGTTGVAPPIGWDVAGTTDATANHTLIRKAGICNTNINWATSAGTTVDNSEWIVLAENTWSNIGTHTTDCCIYSSTWNAGAWVPSAPNKNTNVTIADTYNTGNGGSEISFSACSLTIDLGGSLTIDDNTFVEVQNDVTVNGTLTVETSANFVQYGDVFTVNPGGNAFVNKTTREYSDSELHYVYWSSPVNNSLDDVENVFTSPYLNRRYYFDASLYLDQYETGTGNATPDDIDDDNNDWQTASGPMEVGRGYAIATDNSAYPTTDPYSNTHQFTGELNTGDIPVPVFRNDSFTGDTNWNLIGNPYPSAIDASVFVFENYYDGSTGTIDGDIWGWNSDGVASVLNPGFDAYNFSQADYFQINLTGGVGGPGPPVGLESIPSGQGFFVSFANDATPTGGTFPVFTKTVNFNNGMRIADELSNNEFYKVSNPKKVISNENTNKLWVNLTSDNGVFNQILIGYVNNATDNYDGAAYDSSKNLSTGAASILYTTIPDSAKKFAIQGKAETSLSENEVIKLGFDTRIDVPTIYTLSVAHLQGDFLSTNKVYLKDNLLNTLHDLSGSDYNFTSAVGEFKERFEIVFNAQTLSTDTFNLDANTVQIIQIDDSHVTFKASGNLSIKSISIYDLLGRQLYQLEGNNNEETYNLSNLNHSVFIAKIELSNGALITKKAIKK